MFEYREKMITIMFIDTRYKVHSEQIETFKSKSHGNNYRYHNYNKHHNKNDNSSSNHNFINDSNHSNENHY